MPSPEKLIRRIGVVNWDCARPSSTFFGGYLCRSLGPEEFRDRTPYYADVIDRNAIEIPERTQEDFELELRHAIKAGIDYFAYCWYDSRELSEHVTTGSATAADGHLQELTRARMLHLQSPLKEKIGLCAILLTSHPYSDDELRELAAAMKESCYEKINDRPLLYIFGNGWRDPVNRLRELCRQSDVPAPYLTLIERWETPQADLDEVDALSDYSGSLTGESWEALVKDMQKGNEFRIAQGKPIIPHFSMGWDPSPRVKNPVPWYGYPTLNYPKAATPQQLLEGARSFRHWLEEHAESCPTGNLMVFAWNEFEEGGWICPTWTPTTTPDTTRRDVFAQMAALWKA